MAFCEDVVANEWGNVIFAITGTGKAGQILILSFSTKRWIRLHRRITKRCVISLHGAKTFPAARWFPQPLRRFPFQGCETPSEES